MCAALKKTTANAATSFHRHFIVILSLHPAMHPGNGPAASLPRASPCTSALYTNPVDDQTTGRFGPCKWLVGDCLHALALIIPDSFHTFKQHEGGNL